MTTQEILEAARAAKQARWRWPAAAPGNSVLERHGRRPLRRGQRGSHSGRQRRGHGCRQRAHQRCDAGPAGSDASSASSAMAQGIREVAALPDPVGAVLHRVERPNGLVIEKTAVPMGVDCHHLREPPQRDQRRRRPCHQERQRLHPALRQGGLAQRQRHRHRPAPGPAARTACPKPPSALIEDTTHASRQRPDDRRGLCGPADSPGRGRAHPRLRGERQGPLHPDRHRHLPRLCG